MQTLHYGPSRFDTADAIASAVLVYAEALSTRQRFAVVDIPIVTPTGVTSAHLLIGPGISLASVQRIDESGGTATRDEFGGEAGNLIATGIGDLEVHRAVRALHDGTKRVRARVFATPLDGDLLVDDLSEHGGH
ncbi:hypothetical protein CLV49_1358 [Labedella gwakjiensis]|uniref:Uncharacterized protein n=1 Tax=Labedella gwakjiensis TaxID=390269 RepID=A0A2P8GUW5_9MICO|nr:hypothetical protein [Labedella gwakjiensis]PSL37751.1 hypothetical protein CLV49_1358 [Labedella gwakjiensis]RUQ87662.1 hypothetical protein ELQ93_12405 [Labedella gwakjiensis]